MAGTASQMSAMSALYANTVLLYRHMNVRGPSAAVVSIGDEVLRGETVDTNRAFLGARLTERGVVVRLGLTIPDEQATIITYLRDLVPRHDSVLVCGGIGPTPDDVTRPAVAEAMGRRLILHEEAARIYAEKHGGRLNRGQQDMCRLPEGCELIWSSHSVSPGFIVENVYVFPGVPHILASMWEAVAGRFSGVPLHVVRFRTHVGESHWAHVMAQYIAEHPALQFGSYPKLEDRWVVEVVVRGAEPEAAKRVAAQLAAEIEAQSATD